MGVSQKLIALMAKFLWVSGQMKSPPPIIPYDGIVKKLLNNPHLTDWTALDSMKEYEIILSRIDKVSNNKPAEWELKMWNESVMVNNA